MVKRITDYLEDTVKRYPEHEAVTDQYRTYTFFELREQALRIAYRIYENHVRKSPIVVYLEKGADVVAAFLGVAYSGNYYTPIDVNMPLQRVQSISETLDPTLIITDQPHTEEAKEKFPDSRLILLEELPDTVPEQEVILSLSKSILDTDLLYVLFTSGSTGKPKGVTISHRAVIDYTEWVTDTFHVDETHIIGNQAPFYFDNSVFDIYQMIKTGAKLCIIPESYFSFPMQLLQYMETHKINLILWVPSALCLLANYHALSRLHLSALNKVLFAGEVMPNKQLNMWRSEYPDCLFANLYGPTELTDICSYYIVDRDFADDEPLPIGYPCENMEIIVLGDTDTLISSTQTDEIGELCVRGIGLSYGYYRDEERTKEVFVQNPLNQNYREYIYRTGDLVKYNTRGELIYIGRKDHQIKHNGHRIELGEIEHALAVLPGILENCCTYDDDHKMIVAFYVGDIEESAIKQGLSRLLQQYMIPQRYYKLDGLPKNLNGKIDRIQLKNTYLKK